MVNHCVHRLANRKLAHLACARVPHRRLMSVQASCAHAQRSVAIIGAGAAGLAAAKELRAEGHSVTVLEQGPNIGGVWVYDPSTDSDTLGLNPSRSKVHSSMYASLRTNLPREIMAYADLPFLPQAMNLVAAGARSKHVTVASTPQGSADLDCSSVDARRFCSHEEVLRYLRAYAAFHDLTSLIHTNTKVLSVTGTASGTAAGTDAESQTAPAPFKWELITQSASPQGSQQGGTKTWTFDAVVVANGHYSEPNVPDNIPGLDVCPVPQMHSHNYRTPEGYAGKVVLVVGASNSGEDISRELSRVASRVLLSSHSWKNDAWATDSAPYGDGNNIYRRPLASQLTADGRVVFPDGSSEPVDAIIYCTGYEYTFPFLDISTTPTLNGQATGSDAATPAAIQLGLENKRRYIRPLYHHVFPPAASPWISFLGLPWKVVPFPQMQVQARLVARALSGRVSLPPQEDMVQHVERHFQQMVEQGVPDRYAHMQNLAQFEYNAELEQLSGPVDETLKGWRQELYIATGILKRTFPDNYRDMDWPESVASVVQDMQADLGQQLQELQHGLPAPQVDGVCNGQSMQPVIVQ